MKDHILNVVLSFCIVILSALIGSSIYSANSNDEITANELETLEEIEITLEERLKEVNSPINQDLPVAVEIITEAQLLAEETARLEAEKAVAAQVAADLAAKQAVTEAEKVAAARKQAELLVIEAEKIRQLQAKLEADRLAAEKAAQLAAEKKALAEAKAKADALAKQAAAKKASRKSRAS